MTSNGMSPWRGWALADSPRKRSRIYEINVFKHISIETPIVASQLPCHATAIDLAARNFSSFFSRKL